MTISQRCSGVLFALGSAADRPPHAAGLSLVLLPGIRMCVEHTRHRTVLPLAMVGTASTFRHRRLGHMILMDAGLLSAIVGYLGRHIGASRRPVDARSRLSSTAVRKVQP